MPKIIGEPIPDYVAYQINERQAAHGAINRTTEQITYLNSKSAWVKLASGITIDPDRIKDEYFRGGEQGKVDWATLAQRYVLFGGIARKDGDKLAQRGTNMASDQNAIYNTYTGAYNVNADANSSQFGLQPMPGVTSADIQCLGRGSIKKATVKIKCYTPEQFHILDLLYLRIGYTVFLEWGNSLYLDNGGNLKQMDYTLVEAADGFFSDTITPELMYDKIEEKRREKSGNYDGLLGRVVNFNWSFSQDGSYDITLEMLSRGDVIESLKTNITPNSIISSTVDQTYNSTTDEQTSSDGKTNSLTNNIITAYLQYLTQSNKEGNISIQYQGKTSVVGQFVTPPNFQFSGYESSSFPTLLEAQNYIKINYPQYKENNRSTLKKGQYSIKTKSTTHITVSQPGTSAYNAQQSAAVSMTISPSTMINTPPPADFITTYAVKVNLDPELQKQSFTGVQREEKDIIHLNYENGDTSKTNSGYYIRFGHLLNFIHDYILPYQKKSEDRTAIINIESGKYNTKMLTMPYQVSLDPRVCIVSNNNEEIGTKRYFWELDDWKNKEGKGFAYTMNIYISHDVINETIQQHVDPKNNLSLYEFLHTLCQRINVALGGINNLEPVIDEEENTLHILDQNYSEINPSSYELELYGYNSKFNSSTFVRNMSLKTEITPEFATMASIGSTAAGYVKGTENTMFSKWNYGLHDRLYDEFISGQYTTKQEQDNDVITDYLKKFYWKKQAAYGYLDGTSLNPDANIIDNNISVVSEFYRYCQSYIQSKEASYASPTHGFIPISLGLSLDGISGIKIYNELKVSTRFLPDRYPESLHFIIKGVNHKLSNNDWETGIETVVISNGGDNGARLTYDQIKKYIDELLLVETKDAVKSPSTGSTITKVTTLPLSDNDTIRFYKSVLAKLGAPASEGNILFMKAWRQAEGGKAPYNPFNSTKNLPNSTIYNSLNVRNYYTFDQGVEATYLTLNNPKIYSNIIKALKKGLPDKKSARELALEQQKVRGDLWNWVNGPNSTTTQPLPGYIYSILNGTPRNIPIQRPLLETQNQTTTNLNPFQ